MYPMKVLPNKSEYIKFEWNVKWNLKSRWIQGWSNTFSWLYDHRNNSNSFLSFYRVTIPIYIFLSKLLLMQNLGALVFKLFFLNNSRVEIFRELRMILWLVQSHSCYRIWKEPMPEAMPSKEVKDSEVHFQQERFWLGFSIKFNYRVLSSDFRFLEDGFKADGEKQYMHFRVSLMGLANCVLCIL